MVFNNGGLRFDQCYWSLDFLLEINRIEMEIEETQLAIFNIDNSGEGSIEEKSYLTSDFAKYVSQSRSEQKELIKKLKISPNKSVEDLKINPKDIEKSKAEFDRSYKKCFPKPPYNYNRQR